METLELGGNIQLTGFSELDGGQMIVLKKIIGNYARKLTESCNNFEQLSVTMKSVHETENSRTFELHARLMDNGKPIVGEVSDRNLFMAIDKVLKKVESNMS